MHKSVSVVMLGAAIVVVFVMLVGASPMASDEASSAIVLNSMAGQLGVKDVTQPLRGSSIGSDKAPISIVLFNNYECQSCKDFANEVLPQLITEFIEPGHLRLTVIDLPSSDRANDAALAAYCAGEQGSFWEFYGYLNRPRAEEVSLNEDLFYFFASKLDLDLDEFAICLDRDTHLDVLLDNNDRAKEFGINELPYAIVEGHDLDLSGDLNSMIPILDNMINRLY